MNRVFQILKKVTFKLADDEMEGKTDQSDAHLNGWVKSSHRDLMSNYCKISEFSLENYTRGPPIMAVCTEVTRGFLLIMRAANQ